MLVKIFRNYLGLDLPVRDIPLKFGLPNVSNQLTVGRGGDRELLDQLDAAKESSAEYFSILRNVVKHMNRCAMKQSHRLSLTRQILSLFYPAAIEALTKMSDKKRKSGKDIPEDQDRKHGLAHMAEIAKVLVVSYQIVFSKIYEGGNFQYARARALREECVTSIFELMLFRQQVRALRHQLLDSADWQCVNTLFYVMSCFDNVEKPRITLSKKFGLDSLRGDVNWQAHFSELHMIAQFDMLHWPTHLQWVISTYVHGVENSVLIRQSDSAQLHRTQLMAYCYGDQAARSEPLASSPGPALLIDFNGMSQAIRKDCMDVLQAKSKRDRGALPARFTRFPETEHFIISDLLLRGMRDVASDEDVEGGVQVADLRIYVGFASVFSLLRHQQSDFASEERLIDVLARRSAQIGVDQRTIETSGWKLLMKNETKMRLCTQENKYTMPMNIGSILAYGFGEDDKKPKLAVISRIHRPTNKHVVIDLDILPYRADPVLMTINSESQPNSSRAGQPAMLLHDIVQAGQPLLMFPPQDILPGIDQIEIRRHQKTQRIELKNWRNATHDFYLYTT